MKTIDFVEKLLGFENCSLPITFIEASKKPEPGDRVGRVLLPFGGEKGDLDGVDCNIVFLRSFIKRSLLLPEDEWLGD